MASMSTIDPARHLALDGTRNVRDVGGYPASGGRRTRWRTLLRSDELTRIPEATRTALEDLGLRQVIDLRWPEELVTAPNAFRRSGVVRYTSIPLLADDPTPHSGLAGMYRHVLDARGTQLVDVVRALLVDDGLPAIIGCAAGKDRTGVTIALLLDLVGVPREVIIDDYALSARYFASPSPTSSSTTGGAAAWSWTARPSSWRAPWRTSTSATAAPAGCCIGTA